LTTATQNSADPSFGIYSPDQQRPGLLKTLERDIMRELDPECRRTLTVWRVLLQLLLSPELRVVVLFRLYSWLGANGPWLPAYATYMFTRSKTGCDLGIGARIGPGLRLDHRSDIAVGAQVVAGSDLNIYNGVSIGKRRPPHDQAVPLIGDRVTICTGAKVLGGITMGDDAIVGANAVVLADVASGATVVGIPARSVRPERAPFASPEPDTCVRDAPGLLP
jgi:serine O-acetyltransferase